MHRRQLQAVVQEYVAHYNVHRPHRSLGLRAPDALALLPAARASPPHIRRRDRLGGLLHEYEVAA